MSERLKRIALNYEEKLRLGATGPLTESQVQQQVANYGTVYEQLENAVAQGREVLRNAGVPTMWFLFYHNFTRELFKLTRQELSQGAIASEYARIALKWRMRGLNEAVLKQIGTAVFNLPWPDLPVESGA